MFELAETHIKKTYNDYAAIDDGKRYELINGELIMAPAPAFKHQLTSSDLELLLKLFVKKHKLGWVVDAPTEVIFDDNNTVQPDLLFISKKNRYKIDEDGGVHGAPDLVVEIISSSSKKMDRQIKKDLYEKFGVIEYWIVDLAVKTVEVFENAEGRFNLISYAVEKGKIYSKVLHGFEVEIEDILPDL